MPELSDRDRAILDFEERWTRNSGVKEAAVREVFNISGARYYQLLNALLEDPAAVEAYPALVKRLVRLRDMRATARRSRSFS